jgi:N-acetylneuraminate synthase
MERFQIGDREIGPDKPTYVIAEAGSNHNGDLDMAKELIDAAADVGVDAVKFQTFRAEKMYTEPEGENELYDHFKSMEMPYDWIPELHDHCRERGVHFLSTPFSADSADELAEYVPAFKVASFSLSHLPLLEHLSELGKPLILSTGTHDFADVQTVVDELENTGTDYALLQCVSAYPAELADSNVRVVSQFREAFDVPVGLSDHTMDPTAAPAAAVALGASIVEKHFTLDKTLEGADHSFALELNELASMVDAIRKTETVLGTGEKRVLDVEKQLYDEARRRIQATTDIPEGATITDDDIAVRRPADRTPGAEPRFLPQVVGTETTAPIEKGDGVTWEKLTATRPDRD